MKPRYVNPFTDFGFKKLFGEESSKELLRDFLNAILPPKHHIKTLEYAKNEGFADTALDRKAVFDISCMGDNGERFIVELQKAKQNFFKDRSVFYATFPIREQAERGDAWNFELAAVYCVGVLDFVFDEDKDSPDYLHTVQLKNQRNAVFYDKLTFVYLEMPKFVKTEAELQTQADKWLYFIKHLSGLADAPRALGEAVFGVAFRAAELAGFTREQFAAYERSLKYYRDLRNVMETAVGEAKAEGRAEGREEGRAEGLAEGMSKGREEGLAEGLVEGQKLALLQTARKLKAMGLSVAEVSHATGLSLEEIELL